MKIIDCTIGPYPKSLFDQMPKVSVTFEDGSEKDLFSFYPDELSFSKSEFIGLTEDQAYQLRHRKDVRYLTELICL
jgi:hypothetical protein